MRTLIKDQPYSKTSCYSNVRKGPVLTDALLTDNKDTKQVEILAFIDSGCDDTIMRWAKKVELEAKIGHDLPCEIVQNSITGKKISAYKVSVVFGGEKFTPVPGIHCPPDYLFDREDVLIGRDIMRELVITLNGPNEVFTIERP
ncbi:MAG: hypothetical protein SVY10_05555 [Thermodesulfobacteriota bacterium]|nr:hypothetical protein [Thermodesulfobacteriota bacterium]